MSLTLSRELLEATTCSELERDRAQAHHLGKDRCCIISVGDLTDALLLDVKRAAEEQKDKSTYKTADALIQARAGKDVAIPNFKAFEGLLSAYLTQTQQDGWLYVRGCDGRLVPELIISITYKESMRNNPPEVMIQTVLYGLPDDSRRQRMSVRTNHYHFCGSDVTRKRVSAALADKGLFRETEQLKADYVKDMAYFNESVEAAFTHQFRFKGAIRWSQGCPKRPYTVSFLS